MGDIYMCKYDYRNSFIDYEHEKRIYFYQYISTLLGNLISTSCEVNELIGWLSVLSNGYTDRYPDFYNFENNEELRKDEKIGEYTYIRQVSQSDMRIYSIISSIHEDFGWKKIDVLSEITDKIYYLVDEIIHPYHRKNLDIENIRFYVEVEYIDDKTQKEIEETTTIKYDKTEV